MKLRNLKRRFTMEKQSNSELVIKVMLVAVVLALALVGFADIMEREILYPKVLLGFAFMLSLAEQLLRHMDA